MNDNNALEPITPKNAKELYHRQREGNVSDRTLQAHHYRLKHFIQWCDHEGIENMNNLTGRKLHEFRLWRKDDGDLKTVSLRTQLETLRVFIRFCESIDAVEQDLSEKILLPTMSKSDEQREEILRSDTAEEVLDYLRTFEYGSRTHALLELLWHTGLRIGGVRSLDLEDFHRQDQYLEIQHRPESETALKNGSEGERLVALNPYVYEVLTDWIEHQRPSVTDENGREPLIATEQGRIATTTIRETAYKVTRPCYYTGECPYDRVIEDCEATNYGSYSRCPSSVSPHSIRRGAITNHLTEDVPEKVVSDRMNVSLDVLDKHYDKRPVEVKLKQRRRFIDELR